MTDLIGGESVTIVRKQFNPCCRTAESSNFLWSYPGVVLELTHNYGTEEKDGYVYHNSNDPNPVSLPTPGVSQKWAHLVSFECEHRRSEESEG